MKSRAPNFIFRLCKKIKCTANSHKCQLGQLRSQHKILELKLILNDWIKTISFVHAGYLSFVLPSLYIFNFALKRILKHVLKYVQQLTI